MAGHIEGRYAEVSTRVAERDLSYFWLLNDAGANIGKVAKVAEAAHQVGQSRFKKKTSFEYGTWTQRQGANLAQDSVYVMVVFRSLVPSVLNDAVEDLEKKAGDADSIIRLDRKSGGLWQGIGPFDIQCTYIFQD